MLDTASYPVFWQIFDEVGVRPEFLLPTLWVESGLNPAASNLAGAPYYGINQASGTWIQTNLGVTPQVYLTYPASQQLSQVVLPMAKGWPKPLLSGTRVYQANFLPATVAGIAGWTAARYPNDVVVSKNGPVNKNAADCNANAGIDTAKKGFITVADLEAFIGRAFPSINSMLASIYALRPTETMQDPILGTDPYLVSSSPAPSSSPIVTTNVALAVGGSVALLGTAGLIAWGLHKYPPTPSRRRRRA